jgi:hypothetical protein
MCVKGALKTRVFPAFTQNRLKNYCTYSKNADFWAVCAAVGNQQALHPAHLFSS